MGFCLSFVFWVFNPDTSIKLWIVIALFSIIIFLFLIFLTISHKFFLEQKNILPKVISTFQENENVVIIANPSKLFSENIFYYSVFF
jgi:hypothetical protein